MLRIGQNPESQGEQNEPLNKNNIILNKLKTKLKTGIVAVLFMLSGCNNPSNDEIILNSENQSVKFNVTYRYFMWSAWYNTVNYYITISKKWDSYVWLIKQKNNIWWNKEFTVNCNSVDDVFRWVENWIWDQANSGRTVCDESMRNLDNKIDCAKENYVLILEWKMNKEMDGWVTKVKLPKPE